MHFCEAGSGRQTYLQQSGRYTALGAAAAI
jgi:hypothetical protein